MPALSAQSDLTVLHGSDIFPGIYCPQQGIYSFDRNAYPQHFVSFLLAIRYLVYLLGTRDCAANRARTSPCVMGAIDIQMTRLYELLRGWGVISVKAFEEIWVKILTL